MTRRKPTERDCRNYHAIRYETTAKSYCDAVGIDRANFSTMYAAWKRRGE